MAGSNTPPPGDPDVNPQRPSTRIPGLPDSRSAVRPWTERARLVAYNEGDDDTYQMGFDHFEELLGATETETANFLAYDPELLSITEGTNLLSTEGRRFKVLTSLENTDFPPENIIPEPTGIQELDTYNGVLLYRELEIGGKGYNPRVEIGQQAFRASEGEWKVDKVYKLIRQKSDGDRGSPVPIEILPDVYVYTLGPDQISPYAIRIELDGRITPGTYDVGSDTFSPIDFASLAALNAPLYFLSQANLQGFQTLEAVATQGTTDQIVEFNRSGYQISADLTLAEGTFNGRNAILTIDAGAALTFETAFLKSLYFDGGGTLVLSDITNALSNAFDCTLGAGLGRLLVPVDRKCTLEYCRVYCPAQVLGTLILRPGTSVPAAFFTGLTLNGNGTYTTPDGGIVQDNRVVISSPNGKQWRQVADNSGVMSTYEIL